MKIFTETMVQLGGLFLVFTRVTFVLKTVAIRHVGA